MTAHTRPEATPPRSLRSLLLTRALIPCPSPQDAADRSVIVFAGWLRERAQEAARTGFWPPDAKDLANELDPPGTAGVAAEAVQDAAVAEARVRADERRLCGRLLREWVTDRITGESGYVSILLAQGVLEAADLLDPPGASVPAAEIQEGERK